MILRLDPPIEVGRTDDLDVALALAALVGEGLVGHGLHWIYARGRLLLDGTVIAEGAARRTRLPDVLDEICQRGVLESEHMFVKNR